MKWKNIDKKGIIGITAAAVVAASGIAGTIAYQSGSANAVRVDTHDNSPIVYITNTGECYHRKNCVYVKTSAIETTIKKAAASHYRPCSKCKPDKLNKKLNK